MSQDQEHPQIDFGDLDETFENVEAPKGGSVESIPNGSYEIVILNAFASVAKESGNRLFKWRLRVQGPREVGSLLWRNSTLEPDQIKWFKKDMQALGVEISKLSSLNDPLWVEKNLRGLVVSCSARNKDGYCNIYFNRAIGRVEVEDVDAPDPTGGFQTQSGQQSFDDEVPF